MFSTKTSTTANATDKANSSKGMETAVNGAAKLSKNTHGPPGRLTLQQVTRAHLDTSVGKRKANAGPVKAHHSNSKPQTLTGLLGLSTCNSAFLKNLMADVAKAKEDILQARGTDLADSSAPSIKRRRISMEQNSSAAAHENHKPYVPPKPAHFLDLLWEESWLAPPDFATMNPTRNLLPALDPPAPPRPTLIPATVSETFPHEEADLKPASSSSDNTMEVEGSFGWYVDMDEDDDYDRSGVSGDDSHRLCSYATKGSSNHLAFSAPTAPRASKHDAEIEWAKAADTVDDVLADLF